jgi:DNA-binding YbaB/EbfC family protein
LTAWTILANHGKKTSAGLFAKNIRQVYSPGLFSRSILQVYSLVRTPAYIAGIGENEYNHIGSHARAGHGPAARAAHCIWGYKMAKGFSGGFSGGSNINNLMKQAQKMQKDMARIQEELAERTVEATAGGGAIKVIASCDKKILELTIEPEAVDPDDVEMLQDMVVAAVNEALRKAEEVSTAEMGKATGGLGGMPGFF